MRVLPRGGGRRFRPIAGDHDHVCVVEGVLKRGVGGKCTDEAVASMIRISPVRAYRIRCRNGGRNIRESAGLVR